jgi:large repetitive protein
VYRIPTALKLTLFLALIFNVALFAGTGLVTNVAGTGSTGSAGIGGPATSAQLNVPVGLCYDSAGNLYIADYMNNRVVRVEAASGILTLVAGNGAAASAGDAGPASMASVYGPAGLALDAAGNLYISEINGYRVRRVDAQTGIITTFAGTGNMVSSGDSGPATAAGVQSPISLAFDASGNLFIGESGNNVRRVDAATGIITTALARGAGGFSGPGWLAFDHSGNLLITGPGQRILRFNPTTLAIDTFAGDGTANFNGDGMPAINSSIGAIARGIAVDPAGNVYVACSDLYRIRRIDAATGVISTIAGNGSYLTPGLVGGPANQTQIKPMPIAIGPDGSLAFADDVSATSSNVYSVSLPSPWTYTATSFTLAPLTVAPSQNVTFTAITVATNGSGTPTGTVSFLDATTRQTIGAAALVAGTATFTTAAPGASGSYGVLASYGGDSVFAASVAPGATLSVQVGAGGTTLSLASNPNPSTPGDSVNVVAYLYLGGSSLTPTGTIQLLDAGAVVATAPVTGTRIPMNVTFGFGTHPLTAVYSGDSNFPGSTSTVFNQVVKNNPAVSIASSANPANIGAPLTLTASVSPSAATGVVEFIEYAAPAAITWGIQPLVNGTATLTISSLPASLGGGTHNIQAYYHGDANYNSGNSAPLAQQLISLKPAATISLSSWMNPGIMGIQFNIAAAVAAPAGSSGLPTGSVQLLDGSTPLGTVNLTNGQALFPVTFTTIGNHPLTAIYSGDTNFGGVTSLPLSEVVKNMTRVWKTTSTPTPGIAGSPITITLYILDTAATGTVDFVDGINGPNIPLGTAPLINGLASITTSVLTAGTHEIYATYSGDANYISAATPSLLVVKAPSTTGLAATPAAPVYGQAVQLTASVPSAATGSVQFLDGATVLGTVAVNSGTAVLSVPSLSAGAHSLAATYGGDTTYAGSTSSGVAVTVAKATPSITVSSSMNPAPSGQAVTFTFTLSSASATGGVQLQDRDTVLAELSAGNNTATVTLAVGQHSIVAVYIGDANFMGAQSVPLIQLITTSTSTTVSASPSSGTFGQPVQLTATVTPAPAGGSVQFLDGGTVLGSATLQSGAALLNVSAFSVGAHSITAVYSGDGAGYLGSTSAVFTETVSKVVTTATVAASPNPATAGQAVTLSAAVSPATATGTLQFIDGVTSLGTVAVSNGTATLSISTLSAGSHSLTVIYSGDATNSPSTSAAFTETVNKAATAASLAASPNPATTGQSVTLTAAVSPATATGTLQFFDGATSLGAIAVSNGTATLSISTLSAGSHSLTVAYSGDATNSASTSALVTETVNKGATITTLAASPNPATVGQTVTLSAAVSPATATGTLQFFDGATSLGTVAVSNGTATLATSTLAAGSHSLTVAYSGDAMKAASTSAAVTETLNKAATTTTLASSLNPSVSGQAVTFSAQVSASAATGSIQFKDGANLLGTVTVSGGSASLAVSSLSVGTHSVTAVYAGDLNYTGSTSAALTQTVTAAIPGAATNLTATAASSSQINLAWTASPTGGVTYNVYSSTTSGFTPSSGNRIATGITATSYSHTGLAPSSVHYYVVTAQNSAGESAASNQANATTQAAGVSCQVVYTVTTQWNVGFGTAITIKNTGSTPINSWNLTWTWAGNQQITQAWNANYTQTGKNASMTNASWNPSIAPGATLSGMGFNGSYSGTNTAPTAFYVNGTLCH